MSSEDEAVIGVVGSSSHLSCNMTPPAVTDKVTNISRYLHIYISTHWCIYLYIYISAQVLLVLWFKDGAPLPIYSYDAREFTKKRWSEDNNMYISIDLM